MLRERFWGEFRRLEDDGAGLLVSTHQMDEAVHCDRLLVVREGSVLADTTPEARMRRAGTTVRVEDPNGAISERRFGPDGAGLAVWLASLGDAAAHVTVRNDTLESIIVALMSEGPGHA